MSENEILARVHELKTKYGGFLYMSDNGAHLDEYFKLENSLIRTSGRGYYEYSEEEVERRIAELMIFGSGGIQGE
jgi:hypothetical protein